MNSGLHHAELTGLRSLLSAWPAQGAARYFRAGFVWLPVVLIAGVSALALFPFEAGTAAKSEPIAKSEPVMLATLAVSPEIASPEANSAATPIDVNRQAAVAAVDGLKISSQSWRRGGLGSNALFTFTLRNGNDYAVKDIRISCEFVRRDGSHLTDRTRTIHDTLDMKSRRKFTRMHIGFVNINADRASCALVTASRI